MADEIRFSNKFDLRGEYEPSDSEDDYSPEDRKLLEKVRKKKPHDSDVEEEVYGFSDDESDGKDDFNMADSDVEGQEKSDDDLPDSKAWGKKKRSYYSTDYVDQDYGGLAVEEEEAALMEEQEAKNIQRRLLEQLAEDDFSLEFFTKKPEEPKEKETIVKSDLGQLSKRQKLQLLDKESPELSGLIDDFKSKLNVANDDLKPVLNLVKDGKIPECPASTFIKTNYDLILNYCTNISFYLLLKSKKVSIQNHPVIKRLYQYRKMLNEMEPIYVNIIKPQINSIKTVIDQNIELVIVNEVSGSRKRKPEKNSESSTKKLKLLNNIKQQDNDESGVSDDEDAYEGHNFLKNKQIGVENDDSAESGFSDDNDEEDENENYREDPKPSTSTQVGSLDVEIADKRGITYKIAKNKGLTPHRKKEQRNPRVKHKLKFRKAKIRRKGAVREVRKEISRYGGEVSGIKSNVKKSIKIK